MDKIEIIFRTEKAMIATMAQVMRRVLGDDIADEPVNVNWATVSGLLQYKALILDVPTYEVDELPGRTTGREEGNWEEFLFRIDKANLSGKRVVLFGLGNQQKYYDRFAGSLIHLYHMCELRRFPRMNIPELHRIFVHFQRLQGCRR
ncbi:MAG: flavodoxin domain-containing protein [Methylobacter sp.]